MLRKSYCVRVRNLVRKYKGENYWILLKRKYWGESVDLKENEIKIEERN
jgi:hypothetical protein